MSAATNVRHLPSITLGRGRGRPLGELVSLDPTAPVDALGVALALHRGPDAWWCGAAYEGAHRHGTHWRAQSVVGIDADYYVNDVHVAMPWRLALRVRRALASAPGTWAHVTPRGARIVMLLDRPIVQRHEYPRAWRALAAIASAWAERLGLVVDTVARDLARFYFTPRAAVDGRQRRARVVAGSCPITCVDDLLAEADAIEEREAITADVPTSPRSSSRVSVPGMGRATTSTREDRDAARDGGYFRGAVSREVGAVASAATGSRNAELYRAACALHALARGSGLEGERDRIDTELAAAATRAGLSSKEIATTIRSARDWTDDTDQRRVPPSRERDMADEPARPIQADPWSERLIIVPPEWYAKKPPTPTWLLRDRRRHPSHGVLVRGVVGQLIAEGGCGKTKALAQLAVAVATGTPWLGCIDVASPGRVLLLLGETQQAKGQEQAQRLIHYACRAANVRAPDESMIVVCPLSGAEVALLRVVFLAKGARCGGTLLCSNFTLFRALTADLSDRRVGERVFCGFTGADVRHAREALATVGATLDRMPAFAAMVVSRSTEKIELRRPDGRVVVFQVLPATPSAPRGRWFLCVVCTEADYLGASDGAAPAEEVVRAYAGRLLRGSVVLAESTPWLDGGYFHKAYQQNFGDPASMLICRAETLVFHSTPETRALVAGERARDPVNAAREYEVTWVPAGSAYFDAQAIDRAIDLSRPLVLPPRPGARIRVGVGLDLAFRGDSSVCCVVTAREDGTVDIARVEVSTPVRGQPLVPSAVIEAFTEIARSYGATRVACDSHYSEVARETLAAHGIAIEACGTSAQSKIAAYAHTKELLHTGKLRLPPTGPLANELRAVTHRHAGNGGMKIESPRRPGSHGDAAAAMVAALWSLKLTGGADDLHEAFFDINARLRAVDAGQHWGGGGSF